MTPAPTASKILTINGGSSSLKFAVYERGRPLRKAASGRVERIGLEKPVWIVEPCGAIHAEKSEAAAPDQGAAAHLLIDWIEKKIGFAEIAAVGHRVVHGGARYREPARVTDDLIRELRAISAWDPDHLPGEIALIEAFRAKDPGMMQVGCFDTAFHHDKPRVAQIVAIPRRYETAGVRRYGFHGISYEYLMEELARLGGPSEAGGRVVLAHLGAGASMAAVKGGRSLDTTMGFTPASGLVMATRCGDIDPGLTRFLDRLEGTTAEEFDKMANRESGLLGVSETSPDVRDLLARQAADVRAAEAIELFCYEAKKRLGAFAAVLGGIDTVVFAGGIGENSPEIRRRICAGLEFLGVVLDPARNEAAAGLISTDGAAVKVRVIPTNEELMIARSTQRMLDAQAGS